MPNVPPRERRDSGIILAIVLVLIFALITAVYAFQRRSIIDATISRNRIRVAEADALAKGGLRIAEVIIAVVAAKQAAEGGGRGDAQLDLAGLDPNALGQSSGGGGGGSPLIDSLWQGIERFPIELGESGKLVISIEDEGSKLNLNALVPPDGVPLPQPESEDEEGGTNLVINEDDDRGDDSDLVGVEEEAVEYLAEVLDHIVSGMGEDKGERNYDTTQIAENLLDFIDPDSTAVDGRGENDYYRRQDPPYVAWNRPLVSVDQIGMVEGVDPPLLEAMREYVTVHPIAGTQGINVNRAEPWVLAIIYAGTSGNMRLLGNADGGQAVKDLMKVRDQAKIVCEDVGSNPRCVPLSEVGNGELANGDLYPPVTLPAKPIVFRVTSSASVGNISRRFEAIYDTRPVPGPQLLSWRRLRGSE